MFNSLVTTITLQSSGDDNKVCDQCVQSVGRSVGVGVRSDGGEKRQSTFVPKNVEKAYSEDGLKQILSFTASAERTSGILMTDVANILRDAQALPGESRRGTLNKFKRFSILCGHRSSSSSRKHNLKNVLQL